MNDRFAQPITVTGLDIAFGPKSINDLLPAYAEIPEKFKRSNKHSDIVSRWFFSGLPSESEFTARDGINPDAALKHVQAALRSFEPKHEHKTAGCAYLLDKWFSDIKIPEKKSA